MCLKSTNKGLRSREVQVGLFPDVKYYLPFQHYFFNVYVSVRSSPSISSINVRNTGNVSKVKTNLPHCILLPNFVHFVNPIMDHMLFMVNGNHLLSIIMMGLLSPFVDFLKIVSILKSKPKTFQGAYTPPFT